LVFLDARRRCIRLVTRRDVIALCAADSYVHQGHIRRYAFSASAGAVAAMAASTPALAAGGPPDTFSDTRQHVTETIPFKGPCGGGTGMVTINYNSVFHVTQFGDGRYHVTGTQTGKFSFDPTDPALPGSTGRFTTWFGENGNSETFNATSTFGVTGRNDDGERVRFNVTTHITVVGSDVIVEFEQVNCG
jgi:hypothetical protein